MKKIRGYTFLYTVEELIEYLKEIPGDTKLESMDVDFSGYDASPQSFLNPVHSNELGILYLGHQECQAYAEEEEDFFEEHWGSQVTDKQSININLYYGESS